MLGPYAHIEDKDYLKITGHFLHETYGNKMISIGLVNYQGETSPNGWQGNFELKERIQSENYRGLSKQLHESGLKFGLVPLDQYKEEKIYLNVSAHNSEEYCRWGKILDYVLYFDDLEPIKKKDE